MTGTNNNKDNDQSKFMDDTLTSYNKPEPAEPESPKPEKPAEPEKKEVKETPPKDTGIEKTEEPEVSPEDELLQWLDSRGSSEPETPAETPETSETPETPEVPETPETPTEAETEEVSLTLTNDEFEEVTSSPEELGKFAQRIYNKAVSDMRKEVSQLKEEFQQQLATAKEEVVQNIPNLVSKSAERAQATRSLVSNFYDKYPDLKERREYVRDMIGTVSGKNPDWSAQKVLDEVATRAQRDFNIQEKAVSREKQRKADPKFAGAGGRRAPSGNEDTRTRQQKLLDDTFGL